MVCLTGARGRRTATGPHSICVWRAWRTEPIAHIQHGRCAIPNQKGLPHAGYYSTVAGRRGPTHARPAARAADAATPMSHP